MYIQKSEYYELPSEYGKTFVRLLVQSPTRIYAYWEVSNKTIQELEKLKNNYSDSVPVLKIKNNTMDYSYDIQIDPFTNNYYIEIKDPDCEYQVELGRISRNNFVNLSTSNLVKVPRNAPVQASYLEEVIYRNYIRLDISDKFTIYYKKRTYDLKGKSQDYSELAFGDDTANTMNNIGSMDNVSSFNRYEK